MISKYTIHFNICIIAIMIFRDEEMRGGGQETGGRPSTCSPVSPIRRRVMFYGWLVAIVVGTFSHLPAKEGFSECRTFCVWELAQYGLEPCLCDTHLLYITTIRSSPVK